MSAYIDEKPAMFMNSVSAKQRPCPAIVPRIVDVP